MAEKSEPSTSIHAAEEAVIFTTNPNAKQSSLSFNCRNVQKERGKSLNQSYWSSLQFTTLNKKHMKRILLAIVVVLILIVCVTTTIYYSAYTENFTGEEMQFERLNIAAKECSNITLKEQENVMDLGCGGIIPIPNFPSAPKSMFLNYKYNETYSTNEMCLWTLDNTRKGKRFDIAVKVALLCDGFADSDDVVSVIKWTIGNQPREMSSYTLEKEAIENTLAIHVNGLYFSFTSNGNKNGNGFIVQIDIVLASLAHTGSNQAFRILQGQKTFGPYITYDRASVVINPQKPRRTKLTVEYADSVRVGECNFVDSLDIYEIRPKGVPHKLARLCSKITSPVSYISEYPFVILFYTYRSTSGTGYRLTWK